MNKPTPDRSGSKGPRKPAGDRSTSGKPRTGNTGAGRGSTASGRGGSKPSAGGSWSERGDGKSAQRSGYRPAEGRPGRSDAGSGGDRRPANAGGDSRPARYDRPVAEDRRPPRTGDSRPTRYSSASGGDSRPGRYNKPEGDTRPNRYGNSSGGDERRPPRTGGDSRPSRYNKPEGDSRPSRYNKPEGDSRPSRYSNAGGDDRRPRTGGDSRPSSGGYRSDRPAARADSSRRPARFGDDRVREAPRPGLAAKANEPETPKGLDLRLLPRGVRAELRGLTSEHAEIVGAHLLMAGRLIDTDPELAYAHAEAARRRAARLPITREAAAETAYAAGNFTTALTEFRAVHRMTGNDDYLPAMADCERALGRHQSALKLVREGLAKNPETNVRIELRLVEAGARAEIGQADEALRLLKNEIEEVGTRGTKLARARLRYGYADLLERTGDADLAERWFDAVVRLDPEETTDAADRVAAMRGMIIEYDEDEDDEDETADADLEIVELEEVVELHEFVELDQAVDPNDAVALDETIDTEESIDPNDAVALDETDLDAGETTEQ